MLPIASLPIMLLCMLLLLNGCQSSQQEAAQRLPEWMTTRSLNSAQLRNDIGSTSVAQKFISRRLASGSEDWQASSASAQQQSTYLSETERSIYTLRSNIFDKESYERWQPWKIYSLYQEYQDGNWQRFRSADPYAWDMGNTHYLTNREGSKKIAMHVKQLKQPGDWVVVANIGPTTSIGVQFACDERCGWAEIEVDGKVRWVGNSYSLTSYVEIYLLENWQHSVLIRALGHPGGDNSTGEVRLLAIGEGELHRLYLPLIEKTISFNCLVENGPSLFYGDRCLSEN